MAREGAAENRAGSERREMREHEARAFVLAELHARPFLPVAAPRRVYHFAFAMNDDEARADREAICALAATHGAAPPGADARFHHLAVGEWEVRWEQHTEFATYTWSTSAEAAEPFAHPDPVGAGEIEFRAPGPLVVAAHLALIEGGHSHEILATLFSSQSLCVIRAAKGAAHVLTDFTVDAHKFTRFFVRSNGAGPVEAGRLVQRVLEFETYRTMALLGLFEARRASPELQRMEREILDITHALGRSQAERTSRDLLERLSDLLASSEALSARTGFRFCASRAYRAIVKNRLELVQEAKESRYTSISEFFSARLDPAIETCNAIETRQARLSDQIGRAVDLVRTAMAFELEQQNRDLLADTSVRARSQRRLQGLVQGASVAALVFFLVGLAVYLAKG